jgi:hypothetical protein
MIVDMSWDDGGERVVGKKLCTGDTWDPEKWLASYRRTDMQDRKGPGYWMVFDCRPNSWVEYVNTEEEAIALMHQRATLIRLTRT